MARRSVTYVLRETQGGRRARRRTGGDEVGAALVAAESAPRASPGCVQHRGPSSAERRHVTLRGHAASSRFPTTRALVPRPLRGQRRRVAAGQSLVGPRHAHTPEMVRCRTVAARASSSLFGQLPSILNQQCALAATPPLTGRPLPPEPHTPPDPFDMAGAPLTHTRHWQAWPSHACPQRRARRTSGVGGTLDLGKGTDPRFL